MRERRFIIEREEDTFLIGRFEGEIFSGVYLSPEYIGRLRQIHGAVLTRLAVLDDPQLPDALKNLLGVVDLLTKAHAAQARSENAPPTQGDLDAIEDATRELEEARKLLEEIRGPNGSPKK